MWEGPLGIHKAKRRGNLQKSLPMEEVLYLRNGVSTEHAGPHIGPPTPLYDKFLLHQGHIHW